MKIFLASWNDGEEAGHDVIVAATAEAALELMAEVCTDAGFCGPHTLSVVEIDWPQATRPGGRRVWGDAATLTLDFNKKECDA